MLGVSGKDDMDIMALFREQAGDVHGFMRGNRASYSQDYVFAHICLSASWHWPPKVGSLFIHGKLRSALPHFFRVDNGLHPSKILSDARTHYQIVEVFPLGDFLPRHTEAFLDCGA